MKKSALFVPVLVCFGLLAGCTGQPQASKRDSIPFTQGQLYAAAYLGYQQIDDLNYYVEQYLDSDQIPVHYLSDGDYYLVIPRYSGMKLALYHNDIETLEPTLLYEDPDCSLSSSSVMPAIFLPTPLFPSHMKRRWRSSPLSSP